MTRDDALIWLLHYGSNQSGVAVADSSRSQRSTNLDESAPALSVPPISADANCGIYFPSMVELHMPKRPAPALPAKHNFAKAYSELKKLREDVECIERLSRSRSSQATEAAGDKPKPVYRVGGR
jgi:hypothetical protein